MPKISPADFCPAGFFTRGPPPPPPPGGVRASLWYALGPALTSQGTGRCTAVATATATTMRHSSDRGPGIRMAWRRCSGNTVLPAAHPPCCTYCPEWLVGWPETTVGRMLLVLGHNRPSSRISVLKQSELGVAACLCLLFRPSKSSSPLSGCPTSLGTPKFTIIRFHSAALSRLPCQAWICT